jgi:hypothetical protein
MREKGHNDWFSRLISTISIFISMIALWYSVLAPSELKASMSAPMFLWRSGLETPTSSTEQAKPMLMIKATCEFSNNGAKFGEISYLALRFESDDGTKWVFAPYWLVDDAKLATDGFARRTWIKEPFHPIVIAGKQSVAYSYMFFAESGLANFTNATLTPHKFQVRLVTWFPGSSTPHEEELGALSFDQNLIDNVSQGVVFGMPFAEQQRNVQMLK